MSDNNYNNNSMFDIAQDQFDPFVGDTLNLLFLQFRQHGRNEGTGETMNNNAALAPAPSTATEGENKTFVTHPDPRLLVGLSINATFPWRLHCLLSDAQSKHFDHLVDWQLNGKGFKVFKQEEFTDKVLPNYFNQSKYKSFQRQLNMYGFVRIVWGPERGVYCHPFFIRGQPNLSVQMKRVKKKSSATTRSTSCVTQPSSGSDTLPSLAKVEPKEDNNKKQQQSGTGAPNTTNKSIDRTKPNKVSSTTTKQAAAMNVPVSQGYETRTGMNLNVVQLRPLLPTATCPTSNSRNQSDNFGQCIIEPIPFEEASNLNPPVVSFQPGPAMSSMIPADILQDILDVFL